MDPTDFNALIKEAHELRNQEIHRMLSGASTRLFIFGKALITALRTRLNHLTHQLLTWNPRAHPFH